MIPTLGGTYPEAQTTTWTSYDTTIQIVVQQALKKLYVGTSRKVAQNSRLLNRDLHKSEDHIPIHEREKIDITANEYSHKCHLETRISNFGMRLVRHLDFQERESDRAFHWTSMSSKPRRAFLKGGRKKFSDDEWVDHIWKGSSKTRFLCCKNSCNDLLKIRAIQGHTGGAVSAP